MAAPGVWTSKDDWRKAMLALRRQVPFESRAAEAHALTSAIGSVIAQLPVATVCGYVPVGTEPGSLEVLDTLRAAGRRVLVPVVVGGCALDWAEYHGPESLAAQGQRSALGLREPLGPRLGPAAIASAAMVLVPALAVDHRGVRLGRGGGHYDRSLPLAAKHAAFVAIVRDIELVERLPAEPHDVLMTAALTPQRGMIPLAAGRGR